MKHVIYGTFPLQLLETKIFAVLISWNLGAALLLRRSSPPRAALWVSVNLLTNQYAHLLASCTSKTTAILMGHSRLARAHGNGDVRAHARTHLHTGGNSSLHSEAQLNYWATVNRKRRSPLCVGSLASRWVVCMHTHTHAVLFFFLEKAKHSHLQMHVVRGLFLKSCSINKALVHGFGWWQVLGLD